MMVDRTNNRLWRTGKNKVQPYIDFDQSHGLVVGPSQIHGLGVFAMKDFAAGDVVGWYGGECVKCGISGW